MRLTKLGEICNVSSAGDKPTDFTEIKTAEHTIPVVANGIEDDGIIGYTSEPKISRNAVTISARGNIGTAFYRNYPYYPVIRLITVYPKNGSEIDCQYLYYLLKNSPLKSIGSSVQAQLTVPIASDVDLFIEEDYKNQQLIAAFLGTIDNKISTNNKIIETSEKLMREIYDYWFVQFDFPDENGRPYKSSGGEMVYNENLKREIPKGWSVKRVDELCEVKTGKEDANFSVSDGDYKFFTCADEPLRCNTPCFSGKSILIAGNGNFNVKHYDGNFNAYQRTYVLQPDDEFYGITFIEAKNKTELFTKGSNGSIVKFITKGDVGSIYVLTSSRAMELYETFNTILAEIDVVRSQNEKLASLRDWLLPMLMNGQIKVSD